MSNYEKTADEPIWVAGFYSEFKDAGDNPNEFSML